MIRTCVLDRHVVRGLVNSFQKRILVINTVITHLLGLVVCAAVLAVAPGSPAAAVCRRSHYPHQQSEGGDSARSSPTL